MKILLVDNYDSFTFNLYQYIGEVFGYLPTVVKNNYANVILDEYDAIVISPGPGTPSNKEDVGICADIIKTTEKPLLGICLGHQAIVNYHGGEVDLSGEPFHGRTSKIVHGGSGVFHNLPNPLEVVRYHSLIARPPLPDSLIATAFTKDGLIMGVEHRRKPMWGVQFHPESVYTECGRQIIENFKFLAESHYSSAGNSRHFKFLNRTVVKPKHEIKDRTNWRCVYEVLDFDLKAKDVFYHCYKDSKYSFWLDSSSTNEEARYSYMGDHSGPNSFWFSYSIEPQVLRIDRSGNEEEYSQPYSKFIERLLSAKVEGAETLPFDFCGGVVGFQGYELKCETETVKNLHCSEQPDAAGMFVDRFIAFDHRTEKIYLVALEKKEARADESESGCAWLKRMRTTLLQLKKVEPAGANEIISKKPLPSNTLDIKKGEVQFYLEDGDEEYIAKIRRCKDLIYQGESYEICLTNRIRSKLEVEPFSLYCVLRAINPAPRSAYINSPDFSILCSSPEKFLSVGRNAVVEAKPIKGTRKRGQNSSEDHALKMDLAESEKDLAENLMIVDLLRNDLNRVCEAGSVWVPKPMHVETYASVHQLVSTVRGRLRDGESLASLFSAAFPPGSMTGAPKTRTLEIIDQLEDSARGVYSGSIGYMSLNGASELNVAIRTLVICSDKLEIGVGGAITWLSDEEEEFEEIIIKGRSLMRAIAKYATGDENCYNILTERGKKYSEEGNNQNVEASLLDKISVQICNV